MARLAAILAPAGVSGLWSDVSPDPDFEAVLGEVFEQSTTHVVSFANPLTGGESASTVYIAKVSARRRPPSPARDPSTTIVQRSMREWPWGLVEIIEPIAFVVRSVHGGATSRA